MYKLSKESLLKQLSEPNNYRANQLDLVVAKKYFIVQTLAMNSCLFLPFMRVAYLRAADLAKTVGIIFWYQLIKQITPIVHSHRLSFGSYS